MSATHRHLFRDLESPTHLRSLRSHTAARSSLTAGGALVASGSQRPKGVRLARLSPEVTQRHEDLRAAFEDDRDPILASGVMRPDSVPFVRPEMDAKQKLFASLPVPKSTWGNRGSSVPRVHTFRAGEPLEPLDKRELFPSALGGSGPVPVVRGKGTSMLGVSSGMDFGVFRVADDATADPQDVCRQLAEARSRLEELTEQLRHQKDFAVETRSAFVHRCAMREDAGVMRAAFGAWRSMVVQEHGRRSAHRESCIRDQFQQSRQLCRGNAFRGGSAMACSMAGITSRMFFSAWRSVCLSRRATTTLQAKLFAETAARGAALDAQKRELEVRFLEREAKQRESMHRLNAELASAGAPQRSTDTSSTTGAADETQQSQQTEAGTPTDGADLSAAVRDALREAAQVGNVSGTLDSVAATPRRLYVDLHETAGSSPQAGEAGGDERIESIVRSLQAQLDAHVSDMETRNAELLRVERQRAAQLLADAEKQHIEAIQKVQDVADRRAQEAEMRHAEALQDLQWACDQRYYDLEDRYTRAIRALQGSSCEEWDYDDELNITF